MTPRPSGLHSSRKKPYLFFFFKSVVCCFILFQSQGLILQSGLASNSWKSICLNLPRLELQALATIPGLISFKQNQKQGMLVHTCSSSSEESSGRRNARGYPFYRVAGLQVTQDGLVPHNSTGSSLVSLVTRDRESHNYLGLGVKTVHEKAELSILFKVQ